MKTIKINNIEVVLISDRAYRNNKRQEVGKRILCVYCSKPKFISNAQIKIGVGIMHKQCKNECNGETRNKDLDRSKNIIINCAISKHMSNAKTRDLEYKLTWDEVASIIFCDCHYCGSSPSLQYYNQTSIKFNGIDRVNNKEGYTMKNCVPCCIICNRAKHTISLEQFTVWLNQLVKFRCDMEEVKI